MPLIHISLRAGKPEAYRQAILDGLYRAMREALDVPEGDQFIVYVDKGDSGQPVYRHFCGRCGSPILAKTALAPGNVVVKAGTLDSMEGLQPKTEIYTDHAVKWLLPVAGVARFAQNL
jgi:hypothetical protein